ncbi:MAG: cell division protein FtsQ [Cyclobacteriaceae bacterium]|nr:cell division protein FtsQ [Cyclobacteriaceae bacterium]
MKVKFNIRTELKIIAGLGLVFFLIAFSERKQGGVLCTNIIVELENIQDNHFMDEADIARLVQNSTPELKGTAISRIDLRAIEQTLLLDRHIKDAELYGDLKGNLIVRVELRRPMARIVQDDAPDAYVAEDGVIMGISDKFSSRVMILSGAGMKKIVESGDLTKTEVGRQLKEMIEYILEDRFWTAQIAQMDLNTKGEITIYPQVTGQVVEFGTPEKYEDKLHKLMVFYKDILPQKGWTKYEKVNLNYEGQIIAH